MSLSDFRTRLQALLDAGRFAEVERLTAEYADGSDCVPCPKYPLMDW